MTDAVEVGDRLQTPGRTITEADVVNFAGVSGDFNYLHTDAERMADSDFGRRVVHGALVFSITTGLLWQSRSNSNVVAFYGVDRLRFVTPVYIGDTIHAQLAVTEIEDTDHPDANALVRHDVTALNQHDDAVLTAELLALIE